jgi:hypothetical protein
MPRLIRRGTLVQFHDGTRLRQELPVNAQLRRTHPASDHGGPGKTPERSCARHVLATYERTHPQHERLQTFIQRAFSSRHGASVRKFMPTLVALEGHEGRICGVAGIRNAADEPLFLENYLNVPIEAALAKCIGKPVDRKHVVEIGNLASISCRAAFHLVVMLPGLLVQRGNRWVAFTANDAVRGILARFDAPVVDLGSANAERVAALGDDWGRYYETQPRVMAGYLPDGLALQHARSRSR